MKYNSIFYQKRKYKWLQNVINNNLLSKITLSNLVYFNLSAIFGKSKLLLLATLYNLAFIVELQHCVIELSIRRIVPCLLQRFHPRLRVPTNYDVARILHYTLTKSAFISK